MAGAGSRGGTSISTFYRAWREEQERRFGPKSPAVLVRAVPAVDYATQMSRLMHERRVDRHELSALTGIPVVILAQLENGTRRLRSPRLEAIAAALRVSPSRLQGGADLVEARRRLIQQISGRG